MRIYIVEDSAIVRGRIIEMLFAIEGVEIIGISGEPGEATQQILEQHPDVVILDLRLYGGNGIDVLEKVKEKSPATIVIVVTNYAYPQYRDRCLELGADYFFDKSTEFDKIPEAISNSRVL